MDLGERGPKLLPGVPEIPVALQVEPEAGARPWALRRSLMAITDQGRKGPGHNSLNNG
jgi:hypothetical protein